MPEDGRFIVKFTGQGEVTIRKAGTAADSASEQEALAPCERLSSKRKLSLRCTSSDGSIPNTRATNWRTENKEALAEWRPSGIFPNIANIGMTIVTIGKRSESTLCQAPKEAKLKISQSEEKKLSKINLEPKSKALTCHSEPKKAFIMHRSTSLLGESREALTWCKLSGKPRQRISMCTVKRVEQTGQQSNNASFQKLPLSFSSLNQQASKAVCAKTDARLSRNEGKSTGTQVSSDTQSDAGKPKPTPECQSLVSSNPDNTIVTVIRESETPRGVLNIQTTVSVSTSEEIRTPSESQQLTTNLATRQLQQPKS